MRQLFEWSIEAMLSMILPLTNCAGTPAAGSFINWFILVEAATLKTQKAWILPLLRCYCFEKHATEAQKSGRDAMAELHEAGGLAA